MEKAKKDDKLIQRTALDAILNEGVDFTIKVANPSLLHKLNLRPLERQFILKPLVVGSVIRITKVMLDMEFPEEKVSAEDFVKQSISLMNTNVPKFVEIIAYAITNQETNPSVSLLKFLKDNLTQQEIMSLLSIIVEQLNIKDFMSSIISLKGVSLIKK